MYLLEVEVYWSDVELLRNHDPPHDGVDEEGEEDVAKENEKAHQETNKYLLHGLHTLLVEPAQPREDTHLYHCLLSPILHRVSQTTQMNGLDNDNGTDSSYFTEICR